MLTCKSPRKVLLIAHQLASDCLPAYSCKFSRHDFTLPQLFACLVLREHQRKSYEGVVALLRDSPEWCRAIGLKRVPAASTLCNAFAALSTHERINGMLDQLSIWMKRCRKLGRTTAVDSTLLDLRYRSRHYEQRCRHYASSDKPSANQRRSRSAKAVPKLAIAVDTASHFILAVHAGIGMGSDAPHFIPILRDASARHHRLRWVLADAGYDAHENHRVARQELGVRTLIKTGVGRPGRRPPRSAYRRRMKRLLAGSQRGRRYAQRAQVETANSMTKRNLGDHLRCLSDKRRMQEMAFRAVVHDIMVYSTVEQRV